MDLWLDILQWAVHTPSPHNTQPWKFKILNSQEAHLFMDRDRMLPKEDLTGSFLLLAMAMMVESLTLLAANRKHRLVVKLTYQAVDLPLIPFAELQLIPDAGIENEYADSLFKARRTSRLSYEKRVILEEDLRKLQKLVKDLGQTLGHTEDQGFIEACLEWNIEALFHDLNDDNYHSEILRYFRCTDGDTRRLKDGLDFRCMNLARNELWVCKRAPFLLELPLVKPFMKWLYRRRLGPVSCFGWLSGPFWKPEEAIRAGKPLMRFWLETARMGVYFHPFGNLVTNQEAFRKVCGLFNDKGIWLTFKLGYSKEPPLSVRLPVREILL